MRRYLTLTIASAKGHLNQERQGLQSTKQPLNCFNKNSTDIKEKMEQLKEKYPKITGIQDLMEGDISNGDFQTSEVPNIEIFDVAYFIVELPHNNTAFIYLTGRFSYRSGSSNEYIMVGYHFDGNVILGELIKVVKLKPSYWLRTG